MSNLKDATKPLTITITEPDRQAIRCSPSQCVIANAIHRRSGVIDQRVGAASARILMGDTWVRYDIDPSSRAMIRAYDIDGQVMPSGIKVRLVPPRKPLGVRNGEPHGSNKRSGRRESVVTKRPSSRNIYVDVVDQLKRKGRANTD